MSEEKPAGADAYRIDEIVKELAQRIGPGAINEDLSARRRASEDGAAMSPLLAGRLPLGLADLVVTPTSVEEVPLIVSAAVRHGVPITVRGRGTGNYGQGIPMRGGIVLDTRKLAQIDAPATGSMTAEAGARIIDMDREAHAAGQELALMPSTVQSSIGGFLSGGSGGAGTIEFGNTRQGFVLGLDVVHARADATIEHVEGDATLPYLHSFGIAGIIVRVTVKLRGAMDWRPVFSSFPSLASAASTFREIGTLTPPPKLVSADDPELAATLPKDPAISRTSVSLRTIVTAETLDDTVRIIEEHGGTVNEVRSGYDETLRMSMAAYNHPAWWFLRANAGEFFHLEIFGDVLLNDPESVRGIFDNAQLHLELGHSVNFGMILLPYREPADIDDAIERLRAAGVAVHNCHSWLLVSRIEEIREFAHANDPAGLLNPGKLPEHAMR